MKSVAMAKSNQVSNATMEAQFQVTAVMKTASLRCVEMELSRQEKTVSLNFVVTTDLRDTG